MENDIRMKTENVVCAYHFMALKLYTRVFKNFWNNYTSAEKEYNHLSMLIEVRG